MEKGKAHGTPMSPSTSIDLDLSRKDIDEKMYRGIRSLLYLTASRPDIMFSVCKYASFQSTSKDSHLTDGKRFIRDLIETQDFGLWYPCSSHFDLVGCSDANFAGDKNDRISTNGICLILGDALISWHSKKQTLVALSTIEAEYIAVRSCGTQILWIVHKRLDFDLSFEFAPIMCDST
ncbi:secreted RxLR effector protein 161-like, partial [Capsicum annuum]|uniref:secreted RxLR effector protein 161-like n=1 Tax=Capsicum annuum TaxID=4072 RepID=UPI001FB15997